MLFLPVISQIPIEIMFLFYLSPTIYHIAALAERAPCIHVFTGVNSVVTVKSDDNNFIQDFNVSTTVFFPLLYYGARMRDGNSRGRK